MSRRRVDWYALGTAACVGLVVLGLMLFAMAVEW